MSSVSRECVQPDVARPSLHLNKVKSGLHQEGGECPVETTTTTTTTTEGPQCPQVAVDWIGFKAPADNGAACFSGKRSWRNWVCTKSGVSGYCRNNRWKNDVMECC